MPKSMYLSKRVEYVFLLGSSGDSLIQMIIIHHFIHLGYNCTFPRVRIFPALEEEKLIEYLKAFDQLILFHTHVRHFRESFVPLLKNKPIIFEALHEFYQAGISLASIYQNILENYFHFKQVSIDNAINAFKWFNT
jgi:hypothetical protein